MTIKDILERTTQHFKQKGFPTARLDAEVLFGHALKMKRVELYLHFEKPLSEVELEACREVVRRRSAGEPVAYICGARDFYKSTFFVGPGVLIPRPETELLVEKALDWIEKKSTDKKLRILDLGAGTGCISLSLAKEIPSAEVVAVEAFESAANYFRKNQEALKVENATLILSKVEGLKNSEHVKQLFDLIVSNPPYISESDVNIDPFVKKYEPSTALFAENSGMALIEQWSSMAREWLSPEGALFFEIGSDQGSAAQALFESYGLNTKIFKDYSQHNRIVFGERA